MDSFASEDPGHFERANDIAEIRNIEDKMTNDRESQEDIFDFRCWLDNYERFQKYFGNQDKENVTLQLGIMSKCISEQITLPFELEDHIIKSKLFEMILTCFECQDTELYESILFFIQCLTEKSKIIVKHLFENGIVHNIYSILQTEGSPESFKPFIYTILGNSSEKDEQITKYLVLETSTLNMIVQNINQSYFVNTSVHIALNIAKSLPKQVNGEMFHDLIVSMKSCLTRLELSDLSNVLEAFYWFSQNSNTAIECGSVGIVNSLLTFLNLITNEKDMSIIYDTVAFILNEYDINETDIEFLFNFETLNFDNILQCIDTGKWDLQGSVIHFVKQIVRFYPEALFDFIIHSDIISQIYSSMDKSPFYYKIHAIDLFASLIIRDINNELIPYFATEYIVSTLLESNEELKNDPDYSDISFLGALAKLYVDLDDDDYSELKEEIGPYVIDINYEY